MEKRPFFLLRSKKFSAIWRQRKTSRTCSHSQLNISGAATARISKRRFRRFFPNAKRQDRSPQPIRTSRHFQNYCLHEPIAKLLAREKSMIFGGFCQGRLP